MRRLLYAALICAGLGPMPGTVQRFTEIDLTQSAAAQPSAFAPEKEGAVRFLRGWHLVSPHSRFGGFSAIARTGPDRFQLIGDNGYATLLPLDSRGAVSAVRIPALPTSAVRPPRTRWEDRRVGKEWCSRCKRGW